MKKEETPMQKQYNKLKSEYPDSVLMFRLGDFYEVFNEDAEILSKVLGITLTARGTGESRYPMAGIPYHALSNYMPKIIESGIKVAIAEQTEPAVQGQLVDRKVVKVITSGTVIDESLDESKNNYIVSIYSIKDTYSVAISDVTTGEFITFSSPNIQTIKQEIYRRNPSEVIANTNQKDEAHKIWDGRITLTEKSIESVKEAKTILCNFFNQTTLKNFGLEDEDTAIIPAANLLNYIQENHKTKLNHFTKLVKYNLDKYMHLDLSTIYNLELIYPLRYDGDQNATLYGVLNKCYTPAGKRLLRDWIVHPLIDKELLQNRQSIVEVFFEKPALTKQIRDYLRNVYDIERICGRIGIGAAHPKDIVALKDSLLKSIEISECITNYSENLPQSLEILAKEIKSQVAINTIEKISNTVVEEPPILIGDSAVIKEGYNQEIDNLRNIKKNARGILADMQKREIEQTGISSLKVGFNKVFGYYLEVTKSHISKVPTHFIRKQTLANAERYITEELKVLEQEIFSADEKLLKLEQELFAQLISDLAKDLETFKNISQTVSKLDILAGFGYLARESEYIKPEINNQNEKALKITEGRHPVVEHLVDTFIPNDSEFNEAGYIHILTGPNMSGKSTYIRQVALILLMAQIGSYVPAKQMKFSLLDRIFTRVGASDNLAKGESTFMVEMIETANILNNATENSLVILDEVGRGTSTYDGVAIAWSIVEYIQSKLKSLTLFATHYHELVQLENVLQGIKNYNVDVLDKDEDNNGTVDSVIFTHKIVKGATNKSYGVHVANLAGIPADVTTRAQALLNSFESDNTVSIDTNNKKSENNLKSAPKPKKIHPEQLGLL